MRAIWVARLWVSEATRAKVAGRHGIDVERLRAQLVGATALEHTWDDDPVRGLRALVYVRMDRRSLLVVLYPAPDVGEDCYRLASAYPV